jgi:hypothetical protein
MSLTHSPTTVTSGLVFNYDMSSIRSFKGPPTTNLVSNAATMSGFSNYGSGPVSTFVTEFGTTGWRMNSAGSWNGTLTGITIPTTGTYTFSAWYRYWGGSDNNNGATCYVSGWGGGDSAATIDKSKIGQWQRISITLNVTTASCTLYLISYGGTNGADNSTWDVTMPQVEAGSFATPWVDVVRPNTQSVMDLTNNNTITANSLTYASDNTFSFNGSNDKLTLGTNTLISGAQDYTIDAVFRTSAAGSVDYIFGNYGVSAGAGGGLEYYVYQNRLNNYISGNSQSLTNLNANQWYISSVVRNGTTITHYLNGQPDGSNSLGASIATVNPFTIGNGHDYTSEAFGGTIAAVKVYNRALTAAEVQQNFAALRVRFGI